MSTSQIERVRRLCMALPETTEQVAWGEPTWRVRKKIFVMFANNHHNPGHVAVWCPAPLGVQEMLIDSAPDTYFRPPYVGVKGWVGIDLDQVRDGELREQIVQSYLMIAPKKLHARVEG